MTYKGSGPGGTTGAEEQITGRGAHAVTSVDAVTIKTPQPCRLCPLCRCHHDCRPEPAEVVSVNG
jgi:hypothetical protein